jgi:2-keto-4-pentenoate hydratase/2-oxohepta-3-ene-1,7-dioic acid hydratase in catechol pathway
MKLATFQHNGSPPRPGVVTGDGVAPLPHPDMIAFLEAGGEAPEPLPEALPLSAVTLLAPVPRPGSIRDCMAFEEHVINSTRAIGLGPYARVDRLAERFLGQRFSIAHRASRSFYRQPPYYKSNPRSVVGPDAEVRIPAYCEQFDYELEWGVVIGRQGVDIPAERAREHIAGYTIFNDFSARDAQKREMGGRLGPAKGKDFDTGNAIGPWLVTPDELPDPYDLTMVARVNGAEWSRGSTATMHWRFEDLIAHISAAETLYPGDFIGSGTVGMGCGLEHGSYLKPGDVVELEVEGLGMLRNRVAA